jgi:8-oxo-dGTP pyrophosphatase MutT (NUDIX family)
VNRRRELLAVLDAHVPASAGEARALRRVRGLVRWLRAPFDEHDDPTHVTGSAIVLGEDGRVLLHRHKLLGIWLQPGGHAEPGEDAATAARRETVEETGLRATHPTPGPTLVHVDVHEGPRGHVHLDLRYLLHARTDDPFAPAVGESRALAWFTPEDAVRVGDRSLAEAVAAATGTLDRLLTRG